MELLLPRLFEHTNARLVRTIARHTVTTTREELVKTAFEKCVSHDFDMLPVLNGDQPVGIFWRNDVSSDDYQKTVSEIMRPEYLYVVDRSTPLLDLDLIHSLAKNKVLIVTYLGKFDGVLSYADLNKRPFRVLLYAFLAEIEGQMAAVLQKYYPTPDDFLAVCGKRIGSEAMKRWGEAKKSRVAIHPVENLDLSDLVDIFAYFQALREELGFGSRTQAKRHMSGLVELRTTVMHPVRLLVRNIKDVERLADRVPRLTKLYETLSKSSLSHYNRG